ncbi:MAG: hypothetical protein LBC70_02430 [Chitinispirillales bacterium]|nr:hypothetical protein [Chitinispirillales bacterium]
MAFAAPAFSRLPIINPNTPPHMIGADTVAWVTVPFVSMAVGSAELTASGLDGSDGARRCYGWFTLENPDAVPFVLQLVFENSGVLRRERGAGGGRREEERGDRERGNRERREEGRGGGRALRLQNLELRYRNSHDHVMVKALSGENHRGAGRVYEAFFWAEDVQETYEIELWGVVNADDLTGAEGGSYTDVVQVAAEVLGPPVTIAPGAGDNGDDPEEEIEARLRRARGIPAGSTKGMFRRGR